MPAIFHLPPSHASNYGYHTSVQSLHLKLRFKRASAAQIDLFHALLHKMDKDYPFDPLNGQRSVYKCEQCNGVMWPRPISMLSARVLKRLAAQLGLQMKVQQFNTACKGACKLVSSTEV